MYLELLSLYALLFIFFQIIFPLFISYRKTGIKAGRLGYFPIAIIVMSVLLLFKVKETIIFKLVFFLIILALEIVYYFLILVPLTRLLDKLLTVFYDKIRNKDLS